PRGGTRRPPPSRRRMTRGTSAGTAAATHGRGWRTSGGTGREQPRPLRGAHEMREPLRLGACDGAPERRDAIVAAPRIITRTIRVARLGDESPLQQALNRAI